MTTDVVQLRSDARAADVKARDLEKQAARARWEADQLWKQLGGRP